MTKWINALSKRWMTRHINRKDLWGYLFQSEMGLISLVSFLVDKLPFQIFDGIA